VDICAESFCICSTLEDDGVGDKEESRTTENEEAPLVAGLNQSTDETSDNHDLIHDDDVEDGGPRHSAREEKVQEQQRSGEKPVDISNVEDLADYPSDLGIGTTELDGNCSPTKVAAQGEVGNGSDEVDQGAKIEEDALLARFGERPGNTAQSRSAYACQVGEAKVSEI